MGKVFSIHNVRMAGESISLMLLMGFALVALQSFTPLSLPNNSSQQVLGAVSQYMELRAIPLDERIGIVESTTFAYNDRLLAPQAGRYQRELLLLQVPDTGAQMRVVGGLSSAEGTIDLWIKLANGDLYRLVDQELSVNIPPGDTEVSVVYYVADTINFDPEVKLDIDIR